MSTSVLPSLGFDDFFLEDSFWKLSVSVYIIQSYRQIIFTSVQYVQDNLNMEHTVLTNSLDVT